MKTRKKLFVIPAVIVVSIIALSLLLLLYLRVADWGFARSVPFSEQLQRLVTVHTAQQWLDTQEGSEEHGKILNIYNNHKPLAQGYAVTPKDSWCATYVSCIAIQRHLTDIVPTECGCERQIGLWQKMGRWEENDNYMPLPGDFIYYAWDEKHIFGDCTGWADHVGIVVGTAGPFIKVIEGNKDDSVTYRVILRGHYEIRGYGLPDYASKIS